MAAIASSSSAPAAVAAFHPKKHDVFISFRGEDTRGNFTSHLRDALRRKQIETYIDDRLNRGDGISPALFKAIEESHISVIIFSKNYASSTWCLDELVKILECRKKGQNVIPVFYKVDPSHVRKQKRSYKKAFAKHKRDLKYNQDKLNKWKAALFQAANLSGWDSRTYRDESKFIHKIVKDVLRKLENKYPSRELKCPFGINENLARIESLLREVQTIGIWGMGGIGKTTIAKWLFDKYCSQYEGSYFLANVREKSGKQGQRLYDLRKELFSNLLGKDERTTNVESTFIMSRLCRKRVFIVLDDVSTSKQLEYLVGELQGSGSGSRIIITTRDKHVLTKGVDAIHEVKVLNFQESLQLFSLNAFNQNHPNMGYEELSERAVGYAKGMPLALEVLGSFLHSKSENEWESALTKLKKIPNEEIQSVLRLSFDALDDKEREMFLDIACFFKGDRTEHVTSMCYDLYPDIGLRTLQDKALITVENNVVWMHDLIQEMGWQIVRQESIKEPGRRSRLWDPEEVYDVLKHNRGTDAVQVIMLDMSRIRDLHLSVDTFRKMTNLIYLKFYSSQGGRYCNVHIPRVLKFFSDKLRYLEWNGYPSKSLPLTPCPEKLVELLMPNSHVEKLWDGLQDLVNLKGIDFSGSRWLMELPDFSKASKLETVILSYCVSLCHVHPSLLSLHTLVALYLTGCTELKSLESETHLRSLRVLKVGNCSSLKKFLVFSKEMRELDLSGTGIENIPNELFCLRNLVSLDISNCPRLVIPKQKLHIIFDGLRSLKDLLVDQCSYLSELPDNISVLSSLFSLGLSGSNVECLPASIKQLTSLQFLRLRDCKRLRSLLELPQSITQLHLRGSNIECLPASIKQLTSMRLLDLRDCKRLHSLPELPQFIKVLYLSGSNIECLPASIKQLTSLQLLQLSNCKRLRSLPELPQSIESIDLSGSNIERLPASNKQLTSLQFLGLIDCKRLRSLPELPQSITELYLSGSNIECLPASIKQLTSLQLLELSNCKTLRSLPELPQSIKVLYLSGSNVECLPASIKQLTSLQQLELSNCKRLRSLPELPQSIRLLYAINCTSLETVTASRLRKERKTFFAFENSVKLDEHALPSLLEDAHFSMEQSAYEIVPGQSDWETRHAYQLSVCLPGSRVPESFKHKRTKDASITVELDRPSQIVGFALCVVLSPFPSNQDDPILVRCCQDTSGTGSYTSWFGDPGTGSGGELNSDHVYLWYCSAYSSSDSMTACNSTFRFSVNCRRGWVENKPQFIKIKECGVSPIYATESLFSQAPLRGLGKKRGATHYGHSEKETKKTKKR